MHCGGATLHTWTSYMYLIHVPHTCTSYMYLIHVPHTCTSGRVVGWQVGLCVNNANCLWFQTYLLAMLSLQLPHIYISKFVMFVGVTALFGGAVAASSRAVLVTVGQIAMYDQFKQMLLTTSYFRLCITNHLLHTSGELRGEGVTIINYHHFGMLKKMKINTRLCTVSVDGWFDCSIDLVSSVLVCIRTGCSWVLQNCRLNWAFDIKCYLFWIFCTGSPLEPGSPHWLVACHWYGCKLVDTYSKLCFRSIRLLRIKVVQNC